MKTVTLTVALLLALPASNVTAQLDPAALIAEQSYHEGLYLQRSAGDLHRALAAFERALRAATEVEEGKLVESILLRRAECLKLLRRKEQQQITIAALRKRTKAKEAAFGPARFFPPESGIVLQVNLSAVRLAPLLLKEMNIEVEFKVDNAEELNALLGFDLINLREVMFSNKNFIQF